MTVKKNRIYIIGAGVSGLVAAKVLEENGYSPIVLEATAGIGGRVKTDMIAGYQLDRGFQVLLTAYPAVLKHLDAAALDLQKFRPGAVIFKKGKQHILGDPLRDVSLLFATLFSGIGTLLDKIKILQLNTLLKGKTPQEIFEAEDQTTLSYLTKFGFSAKMIHQFFRPFFSGIFLETNLYTSSKMFQFIYKMFAEGYAALPKSGIGAVADQLFGKLSATTFQFNTKVNGVKDGEIQLSNGEILSSDFTILATEASPLLGHLITEPAKWKSCDTLYFECPKQLIKSPLIGLIPDQEALMNNIFFTAVYN